MHKPRVAFVYDWFDTSVGGAERVIKELHELYPSAPWYTSHVDHKAVPWAKGWDIRPSFLQYFPLWIRRNRVLSLLFMPLAFESFDMSGYDVVVSVTSAFAKGVINNANTKHICYLLTPPRWLYMQKLTLESNTILGWLVRKVRSYLQAWDRISAQRVDAFITISQEVAKRCDSEYSRTSEVVYPPCEEEKWQTLHARHKTPDMLYKNLPSDIPKLAHILPQYLLVVSRLEPYKKVDVAIGAFAMYKQALDVSPELRSQIARNCRLVIVGNGSEKRKLQTLARRLKIDDKTMWLEGVTDEVLAQLYTHCVAFIMPQEEDFGYVALEAATCGAPIVAYAQGGQTEILSDYPHKVLCDTQNADCFARALEKIGDIQYNAQTYENSHIRRGSRNTFVAAFSQKITQTV